MTNNDKYLILATPFSLELIVQLLTSVAQFTVYVLDAHSRLSNIDWFDDYLFPIKVVTSCFEFIFGVFFSF